jgi:hypothetical protein
MIVNKIMPKIMSGAMAAGLLLSVAACSSSSKSGGLGASQQAVLAQTEAEAKAAGATVDVACLTAVVAKMSDADAKLIIAAGPNGNPTLSAAGEALGPEAAKCATSGGPETTTATS